MNKAFIIGRLTNDIELRYTQSGTAVGRFTVAVDRPYTNQHGESGADFIPVVTFGKLAENCERYIGKGRLVSVFESIQVNTWKGADGKRRYRTEILATEVKFLDRPKDDVQKDADFHELPGDIGLPF